MTWGLKTRPTADPAAEAVRWLLRLENGKLSNGQQTALEQWVAADPVHREALERAAAALEVTSRHAGSGALMEMREAALRARGTPRMRSWALAASIAAVVVLVTLLWVTEHRVAPTGRPMLATTQALAAPQPTHYATEVGERATISLPDGSTATLDTQSALDVVYTISERGIRLLRGQALFEVAEHKPIPFQVYAGGRRITAVGTTFNVRLDGQRLRVALIEGKIRVAVQLPSGPSNLPIEQVTLSPGEILDTAQSVSMSVKTADVTRTTSWRDGVSVFVDARLADVVAEMNRYVSTPMVIDDQTTGDLRISGVFKTGDAERFAESAANVFPIAIEHNAQGGVVLRALRPPK